MFRLHLILNCVFLSVFTLPLGLPDNQKCKLDSECITKHAVEVYKKFFQDEKNELDPLNHKTVEGNLEHIKYKFEDLTTTGFKKCTIKNANLNLKDLALDVKLYCPDFQLTGKYEMKGDVVGKPVEGNGDFQIDTKAFDFNIHMEVNLVNKNGKIYLNIINFNTESIPLEGMSYRFENLFNGQKDLADIFHKHIHDNWKEVTLELQRPVVTNNFGRIVRDANKFFSEHPLTDYINLNLPIDLPKLSL